MAAGVRARDLERVLVGFRSAIREEKHVDVAGRDAGQLRTQPRARLGRERRRDVGQRRRLLLNRFDDAPVSVADVHAHQLAVEVDEAFAFGRPEVHPFGARHCNRGDVLLRGPFENRVLLRERDDLFARHGHQVTSLRAPEPDRRGFRRRPRVRPTCE